MAVNVKLLGDKRLDRAFKKMADREGKKIARKGTRAGAKVMLGPIRSRIPVDEGRLKQALKLGEIKQSRDANTVGHKIETGSRAELGIDAQDPYYYPVGLELGTSKFPAIAFMRGPLRENRQQAKQAITRGARSELPNAVRRAR